MSDEIFFDGVRHISANDAASSFGFTRDYIARLCRDGKVRGRRIGKNWYVDQGSFQAFLVGQEYSKSLRKEHLTEERRREYHGAEFVATPEKNISFRPTIIPTPKIVPVTAAAVSSAVGTEVLAPTVARVSHAISSRTDEIKNKMASALASNSLHTMRHARNFVQGPSGITHAALQSAHVPLYAVTPAMEFLHKVVALSLAFMLTFGTYAAVDPQYAHFVADSVRSELSSARDSYHALTGGGWRALADRTQAQLATAAEDPGVALAAASNAIGTSIPDLFGSLARTFNNSVNDLVYAIAFPLGLTRSRGFAGVRAGGSVAVEVIPYAIATKSGNRVEPNTVRPNGALATNNTPTTVINNPLIERVVLTQRIIASGGLTEEILNAKLAQFKDTLVTQTFASRQTDATHVSIENVFGGLQESFNTDVLTVSGASTLGALSAGTSTLASLSVTGAATSTFANGIDVSDGCFAIDGTCISSSGSVTLAGSDSQIQFNDNGALGASSNFTFSSSTSLLKVTNASTTLLSVFDRLYIGGSATSTLQASATGTSTLQGFLNVAGTNSTSTFSGALATTYLNVTGTSATSTFANGISIAGGCVYVNGGCLGTAQVAGSDTEVQFNNAGALGSSSSFTFSTSSGLLKVTNASSTRLSVFGTAYFGGSATSTFDSGGNLSVAGTLGVTGNTTLANATTTILFSTTASSTNLFAQTAALGSLTLGTNLADADVTNALTISGGTIGSNNISSASTWTTLGTLTIGDNGDDIVIDSADWDVTATGAGTFLTLNTGQGDNELYDMDQNVLTTSNVTFAQASTTLLSVFDKLYIGGSATSTLQGNTTGTSTIQGFLNVAGTNSTSTFSGALATTYLNVTGTAATSTFARGIDLAGGCFSVNGTCLLSNSQLLSSANTWTSLQQFSGGASTTLFSAYGPAYFGATATSSFDTAGNLSLANLSNSLLWVNSSGTVAATSTPTAAYFIATSTSIASTFPYASSTALTATNLFSTNGVVTFASSTALTVSGAAYLNGDTTLANATSTNLFSTTASSTNLFAQTASLGSLTVNGATTQTGLATFASGFLSNASSTIMSGLFSANGGASTTALTVSGTGYFGTASTTNLTLSGTPSSILSTNGTGAVGALTVGNGLSFSGNTLSATFSTTTANTWTSLQIFSAGASTTLFSAYGPAYFGATATSSFDTAGNLSLANLSNSLLWVNSSGTVAATSTPTAAYFIATSTSQASTFPYASSTALTVSGTGYFGSASTTNLTISSAPSGTLYTSATGAVSATSLAASSIFVTNGSSVPSWTTTLPAFTLGGAVTGNSQSISGLNGITGIYASTSRLSVFDKAFFGGTATSSFDSAGILTLIGNVVYSNASTSTIPNNSPYAWTLATSTTASPMLRIDTTSGAEQVIFGGSSGTDVTIGDVGTAANLVFQENSTIKGAGTGRTLTFGAGGDVLNFAVSTGFGTTTPYYSLTIASSTGPQLALGDGTNNSWTFRNSGATLYLATSTYSSTSTVAALAFNNLTGAATFGSPSTTTFSGGLQTTALNVTGTAATSTFARGIDLAEGCFSVNGTCLVSNSQLLSSANTWTALQQFSGGASTTAFTITGTGYFPGSGIWNSSGNVGIGTTGPGAKLDVAGAGASLRLSETTVHANSRNWLIGASYGNSNYGDLGFFVGSTQGGDPSLTPSVTINKSGNVGIGTTTPGSLFSINASANFYASATSTIYNGFDTPYLNVTGTAATSTFARGIDLAGGCFSMNGTCLVSNSQLLSSANTWTALQQFSGGASTTLFSAYGPAYFGASATSTFDSAGALSLANLSNSLLWVNASGTVAATTTPTAAYFIATSTSQASTFPYASSTALTISGHCVTGDSRLTRRRRKKKGERADEAEGEWEDAEYIYSTLRVDEVQGGEEVASLDEKTGEIVFSKVNKLMFMGVKQTYKITTEDGRSIRTTAEHPYLVKNAKGKWLKHRSALAARPGLAASGWATVANLREGDEIAVTVGNYGTTGAPSLPRSMKRSSYTATIVPRIFSSDHSEKSATNLSLMSGRKSGLMRSRIMPQWSPGTLYNSPYSLSYVTMILSSVFAKRHTSGSGNRFSPNLASCPSDARKGINFACWFSSSRSRIITRHESSVVAARLNGASGELKGSLDMLLGERRVGIFDVFKGRAVFQHLENQVHHDPGTLEARLAVADVGADGNVISDRFVHNADSVAQGMVKKQCAENDVSEKGMKWAKILTIEAVAMEEVFDLEIAGTHNFVANGIVAHNTYLGTASATGIFTSTATGANTFPYASTTAISASGTIFSAAASTTALTVSNLTSGRIPFASTAGLLADNAGLLFDSSLARLTATYASSTALTVSGTGYFGNGAFTGTSGTTTIASGQGFTIGDSQFVLQQGSGNIGIGTTTPGGKLHIEEGNIKIKNWTAGAERQVLFESPNGTQSYIGMGSVGSGGGSDNFFIHNNAGYVLTATQAGNVGIGTTTPGSLLHLSIASSTAAYSAADTSWHTLKVQSIDNSINNTVGLVFKFGNDIANSGTGIAAVKTTNSTDYATDLTFITRGDAVAASEKMRITAAGNVGIGTTTPQSKLSISGSGEQKIILTNTSFSVADTNAIDFAHGNGEGLARIQSYLPGSSDTDLRFYTMDAGTLNSTPTLTVTGNGNVGIGTTSPINLLANTPNNPGDQAGTPAGTNGLVWETNATGYTQVIHNRSTAATAHGLLIRGEGGASTNKILNVDVGSVDLFTVAGNGNVGIGATSPSELLELYKDNADVGIRFHDPNTVEYKVGINSADSNFYITNTNSDAAIGANATGIVITSSGNVGIGATSMGEKLTITGGIRLDSTDTTDRRISFLTAGTTYNLGVTGGAAILFDAISDAGGTSQEIAFETHHQGTSHAETMRINKDGNVGIGTTTPTGLLTLSKSNATAVATVSNAHLTLDNTGGQTNIAFSHSNAIKGSIRSDSSGNIVINAGDGGNTYINWSDLDASPADLFAVLGNSGGNTTVCHTTSTGNITYVSGACTVSSQRYKNSITSLSSAENLALVKQLRPVSFVYNADFTDDQTTHLGFIAEEVSQLDPRLVSFESDGVTPRSVQYENMTAVLAGAVQELDAKFEDLVATTSAMEIMSATSTPREEFAGKTPWYAAFADASNGLKSAMQSIGDMVVEVYKTAIYAVTGIFDKVFAREVTTDKLCIGETCVDEEQLKSLLQGQVAGAAGASSGSSGGGGSASPAPAPEPTPSPTPEASPPSEETPPAEDAPEESPPAENPPADTPEDSLAEEPPAESPPAEEAPADEPAPEPEPSAASAVGGTESASGETQSAEGSGEPQPEPEPTPPPAPEPTPEPPPAETPTP